MFELFNQYSLNPSYNLKAWKSSNLHFYAFFDFNPFGNKKTYRRRDLRLK